MAYVSEYGNWGMEEVLLFDESELTSYQIETLDTLPDYEKMSYVKAIIAGDNLSEWEQ